MIISQPVRARFVSGLFICLLSAASSIAIDPGGVLLKVDRDRFWLETNKAPLADVLHRLDDAVLASLRTGDVPEREITVRFQGLSLEEVLRRLDVNYRLDYEDRGEFLSPQLLSGRVSSRRSGEFAGLTIPGVTPAYLQEMLSVIEGLADDDQQGNAIDSLCQLYEEGTNAFPVLEHALLSDDYQTRQLSAYALTGSHAWRNTGYEPSDRFLHVIVEGMQDDTYPYGQDAKGQWRYTPVDNATRGYHYLRNHPEVIDRAESTLLRALGSGDGQQRFLSALILAHHERTVHADRLVRVLSPHLRDNNLISDAGLAGYALRKLGGAARPYLEPYRFSDDRQQAKLIEEILTEPVQPEPHHPGFTMIGWEPRSFPDIQGRYPLK